MMLYRENLERMVFSTCVLADENSEKQALSEFRICMCWSEVVNVFGE